MERANVDGYTAFHTIRSNKWSGGVSVFVNNNVTVSKITELSLCTPSIESCVVSLEISSTYNFFILAIYRPLSDSVANFLISLNSLLSPDKLKHKKILIMGYLNVDLINSSIDEQTFMNELQ